MFCRRRFVRLRRKLRRGKQGVARGPQFQAFGVLLEILRVGGHSQTLGHSGAKRPYSRRPMGWTSVPGGIRSDDPIILSRSSMVTGDGVRAGIARSLSVTASISKPCPSASRVCCSSVSTTRARSASSRCFVGRRFVRLRSKLWRGKQGVARGPQFQAFGVFLEILRVGGHSQTLGHSRGQKAVFSTSHGLDIGPWRHQVR